jgi:hypothetical protein
MKHDGFQDPAVSWEQRLLPLLENVRCGRDARARTELNALLRENSAARAVMARLLVDEQALIGRLRDDGILALLEPTASGGEAAPEILPRWLSRRSLAAAAAGIALGMFCTSMLFAYVAPSIGKGIDLFRESFEAGPAPLVSGVPPAPEQWSGDYSETVPEQSGVKPAHGTKMVRLLRSDYDGRLTPRPSRQGDLMRVVDVRPYLRGALDGEAVLTLSALFNAGSFPKSESYDGMVTVYALGARTDLRGATEDTIREEALAFSLGVSSSLDRDAGTWQPASTRLLLPPGTEFVLLKVSFRRVAAQGESTSSLPDAITFPGHFVDDVRASLRIRSGEPRRQNVSTPGNFQPAGYMMPKHAGANQAVFGDVHSRASLNVRKTGRG